MAEVKDYVGENERILNEWRKKHIEAFGAESEREFAPDGIMYRGKPEDYDTYSEFTENNEKENKLWSEAPIRYMFLTKDQNAWGEDAWDVRGETGRKQKDSESIPYRFYRNLMYILYGLTHSQEKLCRYDDFTNLQAIKEYDEAPLARINVKKQAGSSSIDNGTLEQYIKDYKDLLKKQVELLDADVLVCCGYSESVRETGNLILNFLKENVYHLEKFDEWIYIEKEGDKVKRIAINAWHLSYSGVSQKDFYEGLVSSYHNFIQKCPDFVKHR